MSINFPVSIDSLTNPLGTDNLSSPAHATQHANENDAVEALEAKVGIDSSAVTSSHDYKLSGVTGTDKAVSKTGTETLTNKTLTSPVLNTGASGTAILDEDNMSSNSNTQLATQQSIKAYADTKILSSKVIVTTRDMTAATGDVSYTGVGFTPTSIHCTSMLDSAESFGWADSAKTGRCLPRLFDGAQYVNQDYLTYIHDASAVIQHAIVKSYDADGFTLTWTKTGSPTGTAQVIFICYK